MRRGFVMAVFLLGACTETKTDKPAVTTKLPATPIIRNGQPDLLFSFVDSEGIAQTATRAADVPAAARREVMVVDLSSSPEERQAGRYVFIADLTKADEQGRYPVAVASRYGIQSEQSAQAAAESSQKEVVLYSTSWCGVCKKAKRVLKQWKVPFVEKDIEASKSAQAELSAKAAKAGVQPRGVPVIDVGGTLLTGLDEGVLQATLRQKGILKSATN